jgi:hypothetical protein
MPEHPAALGAELREVIAAWLVCLAVAAGCFTLLSAAAPWLDGRSEALISTDPVATVATAEAHRHGRC